MGGVDVSRIRLVDGHFPALRPMITLEKIAFASSLDEHAFGALFPKVSPYFLQLADAIERRNEVALAKLSATLIIELSQRGQPVTSEVSNWIRLFGQLAEFAV